MQRELNGELRGKLHQCGRILLVGERPVWWDGFLNVILRGETSSADDNPYLAQEQPEHDQYRAGAIAGESLLANL